MSGDRGALFQIGVKSMVVRTFSWCKDETLCYRVHFQASLLPNRSPNDNCTSQRGSSVLPAGVIACTISLLQTQSAR